MRLPSQPVLPTQDMLNDERTVEQRILEEGRALEPTCAVASSPAARAFKARLRKMATAVQVYHLALYCKVDYVALVKCALTIGISANSMDASGTPALYTAAGNGSARSLEALLEAGADVRLSASDGSSALLGASNSGHIECVRLLLKAKAPVDASNTMGITPLMAAAFEGHRDAVELLLSAGAYHHARDNYGNEPLRHAALGGDRPATIDLLVKAGANLEARNNSGNTPLFAAAAHGRVAAIRLLLELGADANATNALFHTPLVAAILSKHHLAVRELLPVTDLGIATKMGRKALHVCAIFGTVDILDLLLPYVTDLDAGTVAGIQPNGSPQTVFKSTALQLGCSFGQCSMVKMLLRRGASRIALDNHDETALFYAALSGSLSCAAILLGRPGAFRMTPAEVNLASTPAGWTALHYGARSGQPHVCGLLMQAGASLDATTDEGETPLMVAQQHHPANSPLLQLLSGDAPMPLPGTACERCAAVLDSALMHCSGCHSVCYCCPRCATADWPRHAAFCKERREEREALARGTSVNSPPPAGPA